DGRDADRAVVPPVGVTADDVVATGATGPDVAVLVDEVVVANVAPASGHGVEVVDRADRGRDVGAAVVTGGVVDDGLLHALVLRRPVQERLVGAPVRAGQDLGRADRRSRGVALAEIGDRAPDV